MKQYVTASEGGGAGTLVTCPGPASPVVWPPPVAVGNHGAATNEAPPRQSSRLFLLVVVNAAIVGLVASLSLAAIEIATHLVP